MHTGALHVDDILTTIILSDETITFLKIFDLLPSSGQAQMDPVN
jgi:hypothetical protein